MSEPAEKSFAAQVRETLTTAFWALVIALTLRVALFQPNTIPTQSMEPALLVGDYLLVSKFDYGWSRASFPLNPPLPGGRLFARAPRRGEPALFRLPRHPSETYVKRVIGLPGDRVRVVGGEVLVNGRKLPRVLLGSASDPGQPGRTVMRYRETSADGASYVVFDRGPGHEGDDTEIFVVPEGCYFMMGDNRDNSLDSRWPKEIGVGFVPAENLIGRPRWVLVSWKDGASIFKPWTWGRLRPDRFLAPI
jgi:signal peptidase I